MSRHVILFAILFVAMLTEVGCERQSPIIAAAPKSVALAVPIEIIVKQRSTTIVPGTDNSLQLTIDDITANQVIASLSSEDKLVLAPMSFSPDAAAAFTLAGERYSLKLKGLNNSLTGDDFATFIVTLASGSRMTEAEKIERLIQAIVAIKDGVFIRNGTEHTGEQAADHLRSKWRAAGAKVSNANDFIEIIASRSSTTGQPYQIRMSDGRIVQLHEFLRKRIAEIEADR